MSEIFQQAIGPYNLPLTILVGLIGVYWLVSLIGLLDFDALDGFLGLDTDIDVDVDVDMDVEGVADTDGLDADADQHHGPSGGMLHSVLRTLGVTDAPILFVLTVFSLSLWMGNILGNIYFNPEGSGTLAGGIFAAAVAGAFVLTKLTVRPLRPLMKLLRDTEKRVPIEGHTGIVRSLQVSAESGQVEIERDGASILLNARVGEGRPPLSKGTRVLVVGQDDTHDFFLVRPVLDDAIPKNSPT